VTDSPHVELVRSITAAFERGDYGSAGWAHPEIELVIADGPDPGSFRGLAGMAEGWRRRIGAFEDIRANVDDVRDLDHERVLVLQRRSGRAKTSGVDLGQIQSRGASVFHIHEGK
jgi:hypothetical protein